MPTYDYKCDKCDHTWELFQSITAEPVRKCPDCGAKKAKRVIGPGAGILFKGSGFYQTDYRSESYKKGAEADRSARSGAESKSESQSDSSKSSPSGETSAAPASTDS